MFAYFGMVPPPMFGSAAQPVKPPPVFTAQPQTQSLYQVGGRLTITGAAVSGATALQWQRFDGSQWQDVAGQKAATLSIASATAAQGGTYRLKAVNGNSAPAYSNEVSVVSAYLKFQNDVNPSDSGLVQQSSTVYNWSTTTGTKYLSVYYFDAATNQNFTPEGTLGGRAVAAWVTSSQAVAPVTASNVKSTGQWLPSLTKGTAKITASAGNLSTTINITVT